MLSQQQCEQLLQHPGDLTEAVREQLLRIGFTDPKQVAATLSHRFSTERQRQQFARMLPKFLIAMSENAAPDTSLRNLDRHLTHVTDLDEWLRTLDTHARSVEIISKLFSNSEFLSEILVRHPEFLNELTFSRGLSEFKNREEFIQQALHWIEDATDWGERIDAIKRFQQWELLRIASCDLFRLSDLKTVTLQLSLLADAMIQICLMEVAREYGMGTDDFSVIALGKLGGEELNYSSDIDLMFVCDQEAEQHWKLGQMLARVLSESSAEGFLYRVDLRLRPWGSAGPLVSTVTSYLDYLRQSGQLWEKQALLKARTVAGNFDIGNRLIDELQPIIFSVSADDVRKSIREAKTKIENADADPSNIKTRSGGLRDVEFAVQALQLIHGEQHPDIRTVNTMDALNRLAERELIKPEEFRSLTTAYPILRMIEHMLQLAHNTHVHSLPADDRQLTTLASRIDYPDKETLLQQVELHCNSVRNVFDRVTSGENFNTPQKPKESSVSSHLGHSQETEQRFSAINTQMHLELLEQLSEDHLAAIDAQDMENGYVRVAIAGYDQVGDLAAICGLLFANGFNIEWAEIFTGDSGHQTTRRKFLDLFEVRPTASHDNETFSWDQFAEDLQDLMEVASERGLSALRGKLANRVANAILASGQPVRSALPVEVEIEQQPAGLHTVLRIRGEDTPGFLYELTNAVALQGLSIVQMSIDSEHGKAVDTLYVVDEQGKLIESEERQNELRAAIALVKHITHLLPTLPEPESALNQFQEFLKNLFSQPNWTEQLSPLANSRALESLARMFGASQFLWEDFLKLQHENLFPVISDQQALERPKYRNTLSNEVKAILRKTPPEEQFQALNDFKDREMLRVDMRHILGLQEIFGMFSMELTSVAEVVVEEALGICQRQMMEQFGVPLQEDGSVSQFCVCALGKFGGRELGFASDIELMFIYDGDGQTTGPEVISNIEFYERLIRMFEKSIHAKRDGIFAIDLRLRPYGNAGSSAVSLKVFKDYFHPDGPAWPFERQALVKLRFVAGDPQLGSRVIAVKNATLYRGKEFDPGPMRAMREKQIRQLVEPGTFHAKLSPGGLVDCEYFVQALQLTYGHLDPVIRETNTREAMKALQHRGKIKESIRIQLRDAYRFLRRLIDALRMVRGNAHDLVVPPKTSEEYRFLARRLGYGNDTNRLAKDLDEHTMFVAGLMMNLTDPQRLTD